VPPFANHRARPRAERQRPDGPGVRELTVADAQAAGSVLALAFETDPHMQWIFRDASRRMSRLQRMWTTLIERTWIERGSCHILEHQAACVWLPPDSWQMSLAAQAQLLPPLTGAVRDALPRLLKVHFFNDRKHPRAPAHWYLATVGVAPAWQGRGYGQALLKPVLRRCDQDRVPAYLEATSPRNRAFYERNGFEVIEQCTYAGGAITTWRMWREPTRS
jgi:ribosomal protein S18 acetylase RimI-like enzyme